MCVRAGFHTEVGAPWDFPSPAKIPPPPRNLKINDVIIKMFDFSPKNVYT